MREKLLALLKAKNERKTAITTQANASNDVEELRKLNKELDGVNEEIRKVQEMVDELPDETAPLDPDQRTAAVNGQLPGVVVSNAASQEQRKTPDAEEMEYRKAFQQFVTRGTPIAPELRVDANTLTTDIASAIPTVLVNRIVEKLDSTGMILPLITRTAFASGVAIPNSSVKPVATWVLEGATSDKQKKTTGTITFSKFKLRCEISMSMEASTMAIAAFENAFTNQVVEAMVKQIEGTIISTADGTTSPKGILAEVPNAGQAILSDVIDYETLVAVEAAIPQAYESNARWCMTKKTFMGFVGMTDLQGQPIARVNYGIGGTPERTLLGREVVLCGDYMESFSATLGQSKTYAFVFNFADYALNTVYDMGVQRKQDWDTEDMLTKAVMSVDGKVIDKNSLVTLSTDATV